ncbi:unnamed protein product [Cunninghamella echinulata]
MGRRIDIIFYIEIENNEYELLTAELKPINLPEATTIIQQNKNIRLNKSILTRLIIFTDSTDITVIGFDFVGLSGYSYSLKIIEDAVAVIKTTDGDVFLPRDAEEFDDLLNSGILLPLLFNLK